MCVCARAWVYVERKSENEGRGRGDKRRGRSNVSSRGGWLTIVTKGEPDL